MVPKPIFWRDTEKTLLVDVVPTVSVSQTKVPVIPQPVHEKKLDIL